MKKFRKFITSKGGIWAVLGTLLLLLLAGFLILVGVIYGTYGGNWGVIVEVLTSQFAIGVYVIMGLTFFFIIYITLMMNRNKEIK
jgi:hypothetical protein